MSRNQILYDAIKTLKDSDFTLELIDSLKVYLTMNIDNNLRKLIEEQICYGSQHREKHIEQKCGPKVQEKIQSTLFVSPLTYWLLPTRHIVNPMKDIKTIRNFVETWLNEAKISFDNVIVNLKANRIDIRGCGMTTDEIYALEDTLTAFMKNSDNPFKVSPIDSDSDDWIREGGIP